MAQLEVELVEDVYQGHVLGQPFRFPANRENKYCLMQFWRGFKKPSGKQGIFSQEQIARAIPDFEGKSRQGIDDHARRFRESGSNLRSYLTRQRKVDETVVEAVLQRASQNNLISLVKSREEAHKRRCHFSGYFFSANRGTSENMRVL